MGVRRYAQLLEQAGADALEPNVYFPPTDPAVEGALVEEQAVEIVRAVRGSVRIPIAVKLSPYYSTLPHLAARLEAVVANGLILFDRFYQPDIDVEKLEVVPTHGFRPPPSSCCGCAGWRSRPDDAVRECRRRPAAAFLPRWTPSRR